MGSPIRNLNVPADVWASVIEEAGCRLSVLCRAARCESQRIVVKVADLESWRDPVKSSRLKPIDPIGRMLAILGTTNDWRPLHWLADQMGMGVVKKPEAYHAKGKPASLTSWFHETMHLHTLRDTLFVAFSNDQKIDPEERRVIALKWVEVRSEIDSYITWARHILGDESGESRDACNGSHMITTSILTEWKSWEVMECSIPKGEMVSKVASSCCVSRSMAQKWRQDPGSTDEHFIPNAEKKAKSGSADPVGRLAVICRAFNSYVPLVYVASMCGATVQPATLYEPQAGSLEDTWRKHHADLAVLDAEITKALVDDTVTIEELQGIERCWHRVRPGINAWLESNPSASLNMNKVDS